MDWKTWSRWYTYGIVVVVGLACYLNTLQSDFVYDDSRAIQNNTDLHSTTPWVNLLYNDFWGTPLTHSGSHKSYRPLCVASFRLNYAIHGLNPAGYHGVNAVLHSVVCLLVVMLCYALLLSHQASLVGGLLFATHPIHTEAVAGIVGRADIGACLFFIAALLSYITACPSHTTRHEYLTEPQQTNWTWLVASLVFSAASMLTKEQGITVLGVCAVYEFIIVSRINVYLLKASLQKAISTGLIPRLLSLILTTMSLLSLRFILMGNKTPDFSNSDNPAANSDSGLTRTLTFLYLPAFNFWLLLCPTTLSFDWSMDAVPIIESVLDWRNMISIVFYSSLVTLGLSALRQMNLENLSFTYIEMNANYKLAPEYSRSHDGMNGTNGMNGMRKRNITRPKPTHMSPKERRRVLDTKPQTSSPGDSLCTSYDCQSFLISMAILVLPFIPASNLFFYVGFVVAERVLYIPSVGFCVMVAIGVELLWRCCGASGRRVVMGCVCMMLVLFAAKTVSRNMDWKDGETLYRSGISVNPAKAWANLGTMLSGKGKIKEAEIAYRTALTYRSNMADTHYNLGVLLADQKLYQDAVVCYQYAIAYRPTLALAHLNLGIALEHLGRHIDSIRVLRNATTLSEHGLKDPKGHLSAIHKIKYNLGRILSDTGKLKEAFDVYHDAVRTLPEHVEPQSLYNMIGEAYNKAGLKDEAEKWYKKSIQSKPDHVPAHLTLAKHYGKTNRVQEALKLFQRAQHLSPNDFSVWTHYGQFLYEQKLIANAADMFIKASHLKSTDFDIVFTAANYLREAGQNERAREYFMHAARIEPKNPIAHMNLGAIHHVLGEYEHGEKSYLTALQLKPGDKMTQDNLKKLRTLMAKNNKNL